MSAGEGSVGKRDVVKPGAEAMETHLVRLTPWHAGACARIEAELFEGDDPWPESAFVAELAHPGNFYVGVVEAPADAGKQSGSAVHPAESGELLGYGGVTKLGPAGSAEYEIHTIGVSKNAQGQGLGRVMMDALMAAVAEDPGPVYLEVRTDNVPAIAMYRSFGFEQVGLRKRYYQQSGADAYTMCRPAEIG